MSKKTETDKAIAIFEKRNSSNDAHDTPNTMGSKQGTLSDTKIRKMMQSPARLSRMPQLNYAQSRATYQYLQNMQDYGQKPLRENELRSVYALLAWVANEQGAAVDTVQSMTETHFCVKDVTSLRQKDYDEVIKFLVDLRIDELRH